MSKKVLFASSEIYPFAKSGGLADVAHSLPKALNNHFEMVAVMPLYSFVDQARYGIKKLNKVFDITMGSQTYPIELYGCSFEQMEYLFIYSPLLSDREFLYGTPNGDYQDNAIRFGIFSHALVALAKEDQIELLHLNDWQCALAALLVHRDPNLHIKTLFTIHNLAYQGVFSSSMLPLLGIDESYFHMEGIEFYHQISFMKAGIAFSDTITTVSPTYAKEILTSEFGCGLDGFLRLHKDKLSGILNGIDTDHFSPSRDAALVSTFSDVKGKKASKTTLLKELKLKGTSKPLFVFIGRFVDQKGMELLIEALPKIAMLECNILFLGEGDEKYHRHLQSLSDHYSNVHLSFGYIESLSHRMYAAADFLLMPSLFEPCGLNQMIAFSYGAMPIVHATGGLVDSVHKFETFDPTSSKGYGIVFQTPSANALIRAIKKAFELYENKKQFEQLINHNMKADYSWNNSATLYENLYTALTKENV